MKKKQIIEEYYCLVCKRKCVRKVVVEDKLGIPTTYYEDVCPNIFGYADNTVCLKCDKKLE